jgi:nicotinamidase/pyrazinamidase
MKEKDWDLIIATQDWHPEGHCSFASTHETDPFTVPETYGDMVWPEHCVAGSRGAELHPDLDQTLINMIIRKGLDPNVDSYSAFADNDGDNPTALVDVIRGTEEGIDLYVCGIATEVCVKHTIMDAMVHPIDIALISDACAGVSEEGHLKAIGEIIQDKILVLDSDSEALDKLFSRG